MVVIYSYPYPFDFAFFSRIQSQHLTMVTHSRCRRGYAACSPYPQNNNLYSPGKSQTAQIWSIKSNTQNIIRNQSDSGV